MVRLSVLLWLLFSPQLVFSAPFQKGDTAWLCFKDRLNHNWPEIFAFQVEVIGVYEKRIKVKVINDYHPEGHINQEQTLVKGDVMKISRNKVYGKAEAGVMPGKRFNGRPICHNLM